ncbi:hypothetical protein, conserved [Leishmania tarentolae]|uniref:Uncharacterized protein n=1 Tax=Leishmania tarentolae TaxID=5689 RepID=A0A640KEC6_LEITA|nr:hypothetical protein, conserved [Leishmania tarentolae]
MISTIYDVAFNGRGITLQGNQDTVRALKRVSGLLPHRGAVLEPAHFPLHIFPGQEDDGPSGGDASTANGGHEARVWHEASAQRQRSRKSGCHRDGHAMGGHHPRRPCNCGSAGVAPFFVFLSAGALRPLLLDGIFSIAAVLMAYLYTIMHSTQSDITVTHRSYVLRGALHKIWRESHKGAKAPILHTKCEGEQLVSWNSATCTLKGGWIHTLVHARSHIRVPMLL